METGSAPRSGWGAPLPPARRRGLKPEVRWQATLRPKSSLSLAIPAPSLRAASGSNPDAHFSHFFAKGGQEFRSSYRRSRRVAVFATKSAAWNREVAPKVAKRGWYATFSLRYATRKLARSKKSRTRREEGWKSREEYKKTVHPSHRVAKRVDIVAYSVAPSIRTVGRVANRVGKSRTSQLSR